METVGKQLKVKDWFANKVAQEVRRNISMCEVFAILRETEKAVYAMLNLGCDRSRTMWVPKSCLEDKPDDRHQTLTGITYNEATAEFRRYWSDYR